MSRRLPVMGGAPAPVLQHRVGVALTPTVVPLVAVIGARSDIQVAPFVDALHAGLGSRALVEVSERDHGALIVDQGAALAWTSSAALSLRFATRLLVIVGCDVPRMSRHPDAHALWERADLLLAHPSPVVAAHLAAAL